MYLALDPCPVTLVPHVVMTEGKHLYCKDCRRVLELILEVTNVQVVPPPTKKK